VKIPSKKIKVLFIAGWYPSPEKPAHGIFIQEHAKVAAMHNDVVVLAYAGGSISLNRLYQIDEKIENRIKTIRIKYKSWPINSVSYGMSHLIYLWAISVCFRRLIHEGWRPDIIHAHIYFAGVPAVILGKMYSLPVIITEHFSGFHRRLIHGFKKLQVTFAFNRADLVCPVSNAMKEGIESYGIRTQIKVIPNVVDTVLFSPKEQIISKKTGLLKKQILVVADMSPIKGVQYLLKAASELIKKRTDFVINLIGDHSNQGRNDISIMNDTLRKNISFCGLKSKMEMAEYMQNCDFLILPSLFETFGVVLIEALSCGKPVIGPNIGGPREIIVSNVGRLFPPGNVNDLAEVIDYMLDHFQDFSPTTLDGYVQERYSYEAIGLLMDSTYREITNRERSNG
jgi:glycosyltransferase involved in cell wall biosynthesis